MHLLGKVPKAYFIARSGNLFITSITMPRSRQLLAGDLSESLLNLTFDAQKEPISVERLVFTNISGNIDGIAQLELYRGSEQTALARAEAFECDSIGGLPANSFCVSLDSSEFIINPVLDRQLTVRARMKRNDEYDFDPNNVIQLALLTPSSTATPGSSTNTASTSTVVATGFESQNPLRVNNNNGTAEGEIFVGTNTPAPDVAITGNENDTVFAKIINIEDDHDAGGNLGVMLGEDQTIATFKFTADSPVQRNENDVVEINALIFNVASSNVQLENFRLGNPNSTPSDEILCSQNANQGSFTITCEALANQGGTFDADLNPGESLRFTIIADVVDSEINATETSSFQVSLQSFADRNETSFGENESHIMWSHEDTSHQNVDWYWVESDQSIIQSTLYRTQR